MTYLVAGLTVAVLVMAWKLFDLYLRVDFLAEKVCRMQALHESISKLGKAFLEVK